MIPNPDLDFLPFRDPGSRDPDPGSGFATLVETDLVVHELMGLV
jgi:hypothetical protein